MGSNASRLIQTIVCRTLKRLNYPMWNLDCYYSMNGSDWHRVFSQNTETFSRKDLKKVLANLNRVQIQGPRQYELYGNVRHVRDNMKIINGYTRPLLYYYFVEILQESGFTYDMFPHSEDLYLGWLMHNLDKIPSDMLDNKNWGYCYYYYWFTILAEQQKNYELCDKLLDCKWLDIGDPKYCMPLLYYFAESSSEKIAKILDHPKYNKSHREDVIRNIKTYDCNFRGLTANTPFSYDEVANLAKKCCSAELFIILRYITEAYHPVFLKNIQASELGEKESFSQQVRLVAMRDRIENCKDEDTKTINKFVDFISDCDRNQLLSLSNDLLKKGMLKAAQIIHLKMQQDILSHQDNQFDRIANLISDSNKLVATQT